MPWVAIASVAGPLLGASMQSDAASNAANIQANATQQGIDEQRREFDLTRSDTQPYRDAGNSALTRLQLLLGLTPNSSTVGQPTTQTVTGTPFLSNDFTLTAGEGVGPSTSTMYRYPDGTTGTTPTKMVTTPGNTVTTSPSKDPAFGSLNKTFSASDFWNDPIVSLGYQQGLQLGTTALKNAAPLTYGSDSGAALKALTQFGQGYAANMGADAFNRFQTNQGNQFNRLASLIGIGQTGVGQATSAGVPISGNISNMTTAQGNAGAAAQIASANSWSGGLQSVSSWAQQQGLLNQLQSMPYRFTGTYRADPGTTYPGW